MKMTLSPCEEKVLILIASGKGNKEIAAEMGWKINTVGNYTNKIFTKLDAASRVHATLIAIKRGLVTV
jgi:DNA-binding NarL/FixJ family response regulator